MPSVSNITENILSDKKVLDMYLNASNEKDSYDVSHRLYNSPYHFLDSADTILNSKVGLGRKFMENISSNAAIVYFLPGTTNYLPGYSDERKNALSSVLAGKSAGNSNDNWALSEILSKGTTTKYFDFMHDYANYMTYVNIMCRACALFLGIGDEIGPDGSTKYKYYNWHNYKYKNFVNSKKGESVFEKPSDPSYSSVQEALFGDYQYVQFYADTGTSTSEDFGNSTVTSKLAGMLDTGSDWIKELAFIKGAGGIGDDNGLFESAKSSLNEIVDKLAGDKDGVVARVIDGAQNVLIGANMIFPELWSSSDRNKSYSMNFNLISPYGDKESLLLNIYVPLMHLLALALPKQNSANGYQAPFLVKAFSKGWFSTEMAIVDRLSIDKTEWTVDGLPSCIKVSLSLKDLYSDLMITPSTSPIKFFSNQGLMDFLAVNCGVDITKPNFITYINVLTSMLIGRPLDVPDQIFNHFMDSVRRITDKLWRFN